MSPSAAGVAIRALAEELRPALGGVPRPGPWARRGACRLAPTSAFFPGRGESTEAAKGICRACPVIKECRAYALAHPDLRGIWGGLSAKERRQLRAQSPPAPSATPGGPSKARPAGSLQRTLERLAAHPGRWARVARYPAPTSAAAVASRLRRGHLPAPPGSWRFEARRNQVGGSDLYARLVGSPAAGPDGGTKP